MKKTTTSILSPHVRLALIAFMIFMLFMSLASCEQSSSSTVSSSELEPRKETERNHLRQELVLLQNELKRENRKIEDRLSGNGGFDRETLIRLDRKLKGHQARIQKAIADINAARPENWEAVRDLSTATLRELRASYERISLDRNRAFDGGGIQGY